MRICQNSDVLETLDHIPSNDAFSYSHVFEFLIFFITTDPMPLSSMNYLLTTDDVMNQASSKALRGYQKVFIPLKDCIHNPSKGCRITFNSSTRRRIINAILQPFEGLQIHSSILEGLQFESFRELKD